jgi:hypothetical protein
MKIHIPFFKNKTASNREAVDLTELDKEVSVAVESNHSPARIFRRARENYSEDIQPYVTQIKIYLPKLIFVLKALETYYKYKTGNDPTALSQVNTILSKILLTTKTLL